MSHVLFMSCSMRSLQVIAICEMKEEDSNSQILFWKNLNDVMKMCGHEPPDFIGFMSDEVGANWMAVRFVYNGGPDNVMDGRERSCLFHWEQSLQKYTKKLIPAEKQSEHKDLCEGWRLAMTHQEATNQVSKIKHWWKGNVANENTKPL